VAPLRRKQTTRGVNIFGRNPWTGGVPSAPRAPGVKPPGLGFHGTGWQQPTPAQTPALGFHGTGWPSGAQPAHAPAPAHQAGAAPPLPPLVNAPAPPPAVDVRDSDYYSWLAQRQGEVNQQQIGYDAQDASEQAARTEALRRMALQRPEDLKTADRSFNKAGLFYSGGLGKARGNIEADYTRQEADTNATYDRSRAAREAARTALLNGFSQEQAAQLAAAADRAFARDQENPSGLYGPDDSPAANPVTPAPNTGQPKQHAAGQVHAHATRIPTPALGLHGQGLHAPTHPNAAIIAALKRRGRWGR
jgi:hypothetical protein